MNRQQFEKAGIKTANGKPTASIPFNGGLFAIKNKGVCRLYGQFFRSGMIGKKLEFPPGFKQDPADELDIVEVTRDRKMELCKA